MPKNNNRSLSILSCITVPKKKKELLPVPNLKFSEGQRILKEATPLVNPVTIVQTQNTLEKSIFQQQLQNFKFKKTKQNTEETKHISPDHQAMLNCELKKTLSDKSKILKSVNSNRVTSSEKTENTLKEFQIKSAEIRARREGKNNTGIQEALTMNSEGVSDSPLIDDEFFNKGIQLLEKLRPSLELEVFQDLEFELQEKNSSEKGFNEQDLQKFTKHIQTMIKSLDDNNRCLSTIIEVSESNTNSMFFTEKNSEASNLLIAELDKLLEDLKKFRNAENLASNPECKIKTEDRSRLQQEIESSFFFKNKNISNAQQNDMPVVVKVCHK